MTNLDFRKLVNKYAVILIVVYGLSFLMGFLIQNLIPAPTGIADERNFLAMNSPLIFQMFCNVIISLFVIEDSKKLEIKNNLIIVATIIFSLAGICMFLLLANREIEKANA